MWNRPRDNAIQSESGPRLPGVVDSIGIGYETLLARPHLIVPPVLLDLYLWLGVHVTSESLTLKFGQWLRDLKIGNDDAIRQIEQGGPGNISELAAVWLPTVRMPSFVAALSEDTAYRLEYWRPAITLPWWGVLVMAVLLLVIGFLIGAEYLLAIAATATGREASPLHRPFRDTIEGAVRLVGWLCLLGALALLITWPLLTGIAVATVSGAGASFWLVLMLIIPISWGFVFFFFSVQAMFVDRLGPVKSLRSSYRVVRSDFWRSIGIVCAYLLVIFGFPQVWRVFITEPLGLAVAIVGHAIVGTGMIAATMVFYRDRARQLSIAGRI